MFRNVKRKSGSTDTHDKRCGESSGRKSRKSSRAHSSLAHTPHRVKISASIPSFPLEDMGAADWDPTRVTLVGNRAPILEASSNKTSASKGLSG